MKKYILLASAFMGFVVSAEAVENSFVQTNFVANKAKYGAKKIESKFENAWGIAIRPAGAGGHFWVVGKDISYEYVGDVQNSADKKLQKLHMDDLKYIKFPVGKKDNTGTGVVFNGGENFVITQGDITAPAKFLFASDGGIISAWTERKNEDGKFDRPKTATKVIEEKGSQFFGLAINKENHRLYTADFGENPSVKVYDGEFKPLEINFDTPFDENKNGKVDKGEYAPFNVQALGDKIFVAYAKYDTAGEEDISKPGYGRIAEFDESGNLQAVWNDDEKLSAPWGMAIAPENFGALANTLLVANFGDGTIAAYNQDTHEFVDYLRNKKGKPVSIDKIWGILFGNGESLGDKDALYFTAGPNDEKDGLFGSLRPTK